MPEFSGKFSTQPVFAGLSPVGLTPVDSGVSEHCPSTQYPSVNNQPYCPSSTDVSEQSSQHLPALGSPAGKTPVLPSGQHLLETKTPLAQKEQSESSTQEVV